MGSAWGWGVRVGLGVKGVKVVSLEIGGAEILSGLRRGWQCTCLTSSCSGV